MKKYEVGYEGEFIGVYYAESEDEAIKLCKEDMKWNKFKPETSSKERIYGLIANEVE